MNDSTPHNQSTMASDIAWLMQQNARLREALFRIAQVAEDQLSAQFPAKTKGDTLRQIILIARETLKTP